MFALFLTTLVFAPLAFASVEPWALAVLQLSVFGTAAAVYMESRDAWPNPLYRSLLPAVLAVAALGLLQAITEAPVTGPAPLLFTAWRPATLNAALLWLFYAAVLYAVPQLVNTPQRFEKLMWTIFGLGVFVALLGLFQKSGKNLVYGIRPVPGDAFGPFINRDHGAYFLTMASLCGLGLFFAGWRDLAAHQSRTRFFDLLAIQSLKFVMAGALVYGIFRTGSRGGLHAFAASAALMGLISAGFIKRRGPRLAARAGMLLLLAGYALWVVNNRRMMGYLGDEFDTSVKLRFSMYRSGAEMLRDFPAFGSGLGAVQHAFPPYRGPEMPPQVLVGNVHSEWLELFLEAGFAGGLIYIAGLLLALRGFFRTWRNCRSFRLKAMYGGALGGVLAACCHNFVEFGFRMPANALTLFALCGALAAHPAATVGRRHPDEEDPERPRRRRHLRRLAAAAAVLLCLAALRPAAAWYYTQAGDNSKGSQLEKARLYAAALRWQANPQVGFRRGLALYLQSLADPAGAAPLLEQAKAETDRWLARVPANGDLNRLWKAIVARQAWLASGASAAAAGKARR